MTSRTTTSQERELCADHATRRGFLGRLGLAVPAVAVAFGTDAPDVADLARALIARAGGPLEAIEAIVGVRWDAPAAAAFDDSPAGGG